MQWSKSYPLIDPQSSGAHKRGIQSNIFRASFSGFGGNQRHQPHIFAYQSSQTLESVTDCNSSDEENFPGQINEFTLKIPRLKGRLP